MSEEREPVTSKEHEMLVEIKVCLATLTEQVKQLTDMKQTVEVTRDTAKSAESRSLENEKDIVQIREELKSKATKEENHVTNRRIDNLKNDKRYWLRVIPMWISLALSSIAFLYSMFHH